MKARFDMDLTDFAQKLADDSRGLYTYEDWHYYLCGMVSADDIEEDLPTLGKYFSNVQWDDESQSYHVEIREDGRWRWGSTWRSISGEVEEFHEVSLEVAWKRMMEFCNPYGCLLSSDWDFVVPEANEREGNQRYYWSVDGNIVEKTNDVISPK